MREKLLKMGSYFWIQILMVMYCVSIGYLVALPTTEAKLCSKRVVVRHPNVKKIPVTKRIPAKCSNWDRAWTWLTNLDCGTKYVREYVEYTTHMKEQYKLEYGCCPGDDDCNEAAEAHKQGLDVSDERFLAITFGSATAALTILIIIIVISICRKQHARFGLCKGRSEYESPQDQEPSDVCHHESVCQNEYVCEDFKHMESEYEEIRDISPKESHSQNDTSKMISEHHSTEDFLDHSSHSHVVPSAPLLETLSETYAESSHVMKPTEENIDLSRNVQCTDDIDYIAITKTPNMCSTSLPDTESRDVAPCQNTTLTCTYSEKCAHDHPIVDCEGVSELRITPTECSNSQKLVDMSQDNNGHSYEKLNISKNLANEQSYTALDI